MQTLFAQGNTNLQISQLTGDFYVYTTYNTYEGNRIPANGMYILTDSGVILIDTPWDTTQFQSLLDSIQVRHHKNVVLCLVTHWHSDKTEGLEYYRQLGIKTYSTTLTDELCQKNSMKRAEFLMPKDTLFHVGKYTLETYFPGEGHTTDNIVIWFKNEKILYGGCLIKGAEAKNLGYLGDANLSTYQASLENVRRKFPDPNYIVVSHSDWKDINSLNHSIKLAKKLKRQH
jgi:metallo-beta-lactamase class B